MRYTFPHTITKNEGAAIAARDPCALTGVASLRGRIAGRSVPFLIVGAPCAPTGSASLRDSIAGRPVTFLIVGAPGTPTGSASLRDRFAGRSVTLALWGKVMQYKKICV